jgi:hypothetical protein
MGLLTALLLKALVEELRIEGYGLDKNGAVESRYYVMSSPF